MTQGKAASVACLLSAFALWCLLAPGEHVLQLSRHQVAAVALVQPRFLTENESDVKAGEEGEEEGEEGEEEGEEEEGEEKPNPVAVASGAMLIGMVLFVLSLFYLVNAHSEGIRSNSWLVIDSTVSIFCAVILHQAVDSVLDHLDLGHLRLVLSLVHLVVWWIATLLIVGCIAKAAEGSHSKSAHYRVTAAATIGSHTCGFACKEFFVTLQEVDPFKDSVGMAVVALIICFIFMAGIFGVGHLLRKSASIKGHLSHAMVEIEDDAACLSLSYVVAHVVRYLILGRMPMTEMSEEGHDSFHNTILIIVTVLSAVLVFLGPLFDKCLPDRPADLAELFFAMFFSWNLLYLGCWTIYAAEWAQTHEVLSRIVLAVLMSFKCTIVLVVLDIVVRSLPNMDMKKSVNAVIIGQGLTVAFSWELSFDVAFEVLWDHEDEGWKTPMLKMAMCLFMVIILVPAYVWHIMPKVEEARKTIIEEIGPDEEEREGESEHEEKHEEGNKVVVEGKKAVEG